MQISLLILHFIVIIFLISRLSFFKDSGLSLFELLLFFLLKVFVGFFLIWVYSNIYPERNRADVFKYFDDACIIWSNANSSVFSVFQFMFSPLSPSFQSLIANTHHVDKQGGGFLDASHLSVIKLNLLIRLFSSGFIFIHSLWFSFLSFIGCVAIYKVFSVINEKGKAALKFSFFLLPSLLFWGSGLIKESLVFFSLGVLIFSFHKFVTTKSIQALGFFILFLFFLFTLKPFTLFAIILSVFFYVLPSKFKFAFSILLSLLFLLFSGPIASKLLVKRNEFTRNAEKRNASSVIDTTIYEGKNTELIKLMPSAISSVLFKPNFFQKFSKRDILFALENVVFLILLIFALYNFRCYSSFNFSLLFSLVIFAIAQLLIIGYSVSVLGAIVRYKVTAFPFLWYIVLYPYNLKKYIYDKICRKT